MTVAAWRLWHCACLVILHARGSNISEPSITCACRYVTSNPQYADSTAYAGKFRQLHARAMAAVRSKVQQVLRHATEQVSTQLSYWCYSKTA